MPAGVEIRTALEAQEAFLLVKDSGAGTIVRSGAYLVCSDEL